MLLDSLNNGCLPPTLRQSCISLILKKDKDPHECGSYRPISLLNVDVKILAKMLAKRLESVLPTIIHSDQTGFIKNRLLSHNIRRAFNIIYSSNSHPSEALLLLDAEKAFDRVEWDYLFCVLQKFGFGNTFISWIKLLYSSPVCSVQANGVSSSIFPLKRGTRQGCPLSPLLFALVIEPLAIAIRSEQAIQGITRADAVHKISLYADDVLLYISDPVVSLPEALRIINSFSLFSGYKLNINKSELFPINFSISDLPMSTSMFKVTSHSFKYLGVAITRKCLDLFKANFTTLLQRVQKDFTRWSALPLSLAGRVNSVKMNVLPRFLYLFQCVPIFIPKSFFKTLNQHISSFIWNKGPARIRREILQKPKLEGGLALPNFLFYYWAANIHSTLFWFQSHFGLSDWVPSWVSIEEGSCSPASPAALLCGPLTAISRCPYGNSIVRQSLRIWSQFRTHFGLQRLPVVSPINRNPLFPPSLNDKAFNTWQRAGISVVNDIYIDNVFPCFSQLKQKFSLSSAQFFRYLQILLKTHSLIFRIFLQNHRSIRFLK